MTYLLAVAQPGGASPARKKEKKREKKEKKEKKEKERQTERKKERWSQNGEGLQALPKLTFHPFNLKELVDGDASRHPQRLRFVSVLE